MTQQGGDTVHESGDTRTVYYNNSDNSVDPLEAGMWFQVDAEHTDGTTEVDSADDTNNTRLDGVAGADISPSSKGNGVFRGVVKARVTSGVTAGDNLQPDSTAGVATSGGSSGYIALTDATQDADNNYYAEVKLE